MRINLIIVIMMYAEATFLKNGQGNWDAFCEYMGALFQEPFWSPENPEGRRILFKHAEESKNSFLNEFNMPGCYIFGVHKKMLYVGQTTSDLWKRLRGRYFIGAKTQYELAKKYEQILIEEGIHGFPPKLIAEYKTQYHGSTIRLEGAVMFARSGVDEVWFHLLPRSDVDYISELEQTLIEFCNAWNIRHGFEPMLNQKFKLNDNQCMQRRA